MKKVWKATITKAIDDIKTKEVDTAVKEAKKKVKKAVEAARKAEERSKLPGKTLVYQTADRKYYKISGERVDASSLFWEASVAGLPPAYTVLTQGDKLYVRGPGGAKKL